MPRCRQHLRCLPAASNDQQDPPSPAFHVHTPWSLRGQHLVRQPAVKHHQPPTQRRHHCDRLALMIATGAAAAATIACTVATTAAIVAAISAAAVSWVWGCSCGRLARLVAGIVDEQLAAILLHAKGQQQDQGAKKARHT